MVYIKKEDVTKRYGLFFRKDDGPETQIFKGEAEDAKVEIEFISERDATGAKARISFYQNGSVVELFLRELQ